MRLKFYFSAIPFHVTCSQSLMSKAEGQSLSPPKLFCNKAHSIRRGQKKRSFFKALNFVKTCCGWQVGRMAEQDAQLVQLVITFVRNLLCIPDRTSTAGELSFTMFLHPPPLPFSFPFSQSAALLNVESILAVGDG